MPKKITTVVEDYVGERYSATESGRGSLIVIRWADFHMTGGAPKFVIGNMTASLGEIAAVGN